MTRIACPCCVQRVCCLSSELARRPSFLSFFLNYLFIYGCAGSSLLPLWCVGFSLQWLLLLQDTGSGPHGLGSWGAQASLLHGMWDLSEPEIEPGSPAQAGRFFAAEPPGKPVLSLLGPHSCFPQSITSFADGLPARVVIAPQLATNSSDTFSALGASAQWSLLGPRVQLGRAVAPAPG